MATMGMHLVCLSHDPTIRSNEFEVTDLDTIHTVFALDRAGYLSESNLKIELAPGHANREAFIFLRDHPVCRVGYVPYDFSNDKPTPIEFDSRVKPERLLTLYRHRVDKLLILSNHLELAFARREAEQAITNKKQEKKK